MYREREREIGIGIVIINTKFCRCPRKMGGSGPGPSPVMEAPCRRTLLQLFSLAGKGCVGKENSLAMQPSAVRSLSTHPLDRKT